MLNYQRVFQTSTFEETKHCWRQDTTTELPPERWDMDAYYDADVDAPGGCEIQFMAWYPHEIPVNPIRCHWEKTKDQNGRANSLTFLFFS